MQKEPCLTPMVLCHGHQANFCREFIKHINFKDTLFIKFLLKKILLVKSLGKWFVHTYQIYCGMSMYGHPVYNIKERPHFLSFITYLSHKLEYFHVGPTLLSSPSFFLSYALYSQSGWQMIYIKRITHLFLDSRALIHFRGQMTGLPRIGPQKPGRPWVEQAT